MSLIRRASSGSRRVKRSEQVGMSPFSAGAIAVAIAVLATFFGFAKHIPGTHGYRLKGVFASATSIRVNAPVRIAGVNVGRVKKIERNGGSPSSVVTIELQKRALPIHADATMKIRPRIFLEGNFFVDLRPGTPSAPKLPSGATLAITHTAAPVQLDQVLTSLQYDARQDLKDILDAYGTALTHQPTPAEDRTQDPRVRGKTAAQALNETYRYAAGGLRDTAIVNDAATGSERHDLSKLVAGLGKVVAALDRHEGQLQDLITNFNVTAGALASRASELRASTRLLAPTVENAGTALAHLNAALPATRAFAREILPGVRETPATIEAAFPWIAQARPLLGPRELRGVARELRPTAAKLAALIDRTLPLLPQLDLIDRCATNVILPSGDVVLNDGPLSTGAANYKEFWYSLVGLTGEGQNFDGNSMYVRFQPGGGLNTVSTGASSLSFDRLFGNAVSRPIGTRPQFPGRRPPYVSSVPCYRSKPPNLNGPAAQLGPAESVVRTSSASAAAARIAQLVEPAAKGARP